ncbi:MAG: ubiquinol-cytochrome c reductase iron-sulfur subunit [Alphaproteobacteria bacterium]|jgi:ubiquinol-cytochrome c reductase iron-sulfur subunit|nr:ubiquinol-cytochrome c reductase iron-sulfur subunit [Alphaproteobacteria bacterium]MDP6832523.1 ubiquinol-cytochrome c reductase iron-sulfur subunit [Alphaproteobacteria bacterium]MDP6875311.1 ubiquinol-cytochrome c reductase iron-sulfur subunit [Alphaproteobacteria bacterium]
MADSTGGDTHDPSRRDFLYVAAAGLGAVGTVGFVWPLVDQMNPSQDVLALSSIEVDLSGIEVGQSITVSWRGKPVFIRHRTEAEIAKAKDVAMADLPDPEGDDVRAEKPQWLVLVGVCTHLGCVPLGQAGEYNGWFCPCHGSHYDTSGRIRKGPAPTNLPVPKYVFLDDNNIKIG